MTARLSISIAAAPLINLRELIELFERHPVDMLHFDIEDGLFVPSITLGTKIIKDLRPLTDLPFEVHLMVEHPENYIQELVENGANRVTVHWEACRYPFRTLSMIKEFGVTSGLAFNPKTTLPDLGFVFPVLDFINILSTEPQINNSQFIPEMMRKISMLKTNEELHDVELEIDGGLNIHYANQAARAGVDTFIVGRSIFENGNISGNIRAMVKAISEG